jgi:hemolysin activation/secretion protein
MYAKHLYPVKLLTVFTIALNLGLLVVVVVDGIFGKAQSQLNIPNIPIPPTVTPTPPQPQIPEQLLSPDELLEISPSIPTSPEEIPESSITLTVKRFDFVGNTEAIFSQDKLRKELEELTKPENQPITFTQLLQGASKITNLYIQKGYVTSGAYIPAQTPKDGVVKIQIVEGSLQEIRITTEERRRKRLNDNYVRSRLQSATAKPLNIRRLEEALQLLKLNPLIKTLSAKLSAGTIPGTNLLTVEIEEANSSGAKIIADNSRNPSVGTFRRGLEIKEGNLTGLGDRLNIAYDNTDGSNAIDASYTIPINAHNGTVALNYSGTHSNIIERPFNQLDINSDSRNYEITLRQPLVENAKKQFTQELAIGLTFARRESNTSVLGVNFPISLGADSQGNTRISALRFFQEWTKSSLQQVLVARSQFSLGIGAFDATINNQAPDSRFFAWRGQLSWLRSLGKATDNPRVTPRILLRSDLQLANKALVPIEQFTLGGIFSVRGYRQDAIFADNGFFTSADFQLPIYSTNQGENTLQLIPFIDIGTAWNSSNRQISSPQTLASFGLGLQWEMGSKFKTRLDYGIPLVDINSRERTWQEKGLYFSIQYNPF